MSDFKPVSEHEVLPEPEWEKPAAPKLDRAELAHAWKAEKQRLGNPESIKRVTYKSAEWSQLVHAGWSTVDVEGQGSANQIAVMQPPKS